MSENDNNRLGGTAGQNFGARSTTQDPLGNMLDGRDDPNRGPLDRMTNALDGRDDPDRGPLDRTTNALGGGMGAATGSHQRVVSAVFDSQDEAQRAVAELRSAGVSDRSLSVIAQHDGKTTTTSGDGEITDDGHRNLLRGILGGGALGAGLGVAALAIPGVGPLAAAGAIAASVVPEAMALGAAAGAVGGTLNEVLTKHGVSDEDASYYGDRIKSGGVFVSVDTAEAGVGPDMVGDILHRAGGHSSSRARMS
jgi:hypothetical protein